MKSVLLLFCVLSFGVLIVSCKKDKDPDPPVDESYPKGTLDLGSTFSADFFGRVVDENGDPVAGADISIGTASGSTDQNGVFKLDQAVVNSKLAYVKAEKPGYFMGSRSLIPDQGSLNFVQITLFTKQLTMSTVTDQPTTVHVHNGVSIDLPSRYTDQFGLSYTGGINIYTRFVSSDELDIDKAPGCNLGQGADGVERYFESYGMLLVELEGIGGQPLKMAAGTKATLHIRIDDSQIANAPGGLPMTYFDESAGYWVENGWAIKEQDEYTGTVTHFDYWNFAHAYSAAEVHGVILNHLGDSLANFPVQNSSENGNGQCYTSSNGTFRTYVPADLSIDWSTIDECGNTTVIATAGPYGSATPYTEMIQIPDGTVDLTQQFGDLLDCNTNPVSNGYVILTVGSTDYLQYVSNASFVVDLINCEGVGNYEVIGFDMGTSEQSIIYQKGITTSINYTGTVLACAGTAEYLAFSIDGGTPYLYTADIFCGLTDTGGGTFLHIYPVDHSIEILSQVYSPGGYDYYANVQSNTIWVHTLDFNPFGSFSIHTELLEWNSPGNLVSLTFSGFYTDQLLVQHDLNGDLVVFRDL